MSTSEVESIIEGHGGGTGPGGGGRRALAHNINSTFTKKHLKHESATANHTHKFNRKRSQSQTSGSGGGKFHPPHKKRRSQTSILPTKFLLGGNICDPLNLGSFQDEDINRAMNAVTPKSSPLPTPKHRKGEIEVIIPPNINDPLNLNSCENDEEYVAQLAKTSPVKRPRPKSKRKRKRINSSSQSKEEVVEGSACGEVPAVIEPPTVVPAEVEPAVATVPTEPAISRVTAELHLNLDTTSHDTSTTNLESPTKKSQWQRRSDEAGKDRRPRKMDLKDKIVSPVIWQPGQKPLHPRIRHKTGKNEAKQQNQPKFNPKSAAFQYGNYNRYYGYRNVLHAPDVRLKCFSNFPDLFKDKDVLDIGCNIGHITLSVGRDFRARSVIGIDIDRKLVEIARKNVQYYVNYEQSPATRGTPNKTNDDQAGEDKRFVSAAHSNERFFPISMPIVFGPVDIPGITDGMGSKAASAPKPFPRNVSFVQGNYVLESDALLALEKPQFDVILCLSMTKWIHLNWGDAGLKRAFRRMFSQLRPGGRLILESQGWPSYKKKKNMTERIWTNFKAISFFPHQFRAYLLSPEVGFSKCQILDVPQHSSKGFCRPITMFFKATNEETKSERTEDSSCLPKDASLETTTAQASSSVSCENRDPAGVQTSEISSLDTRETTAEAVRNSEQCETNSESVETVETGHRSSIVQTAVTSSAEAGKTAAEPARDSETCDAKKTCIETIETPSDVCEKRTETVETDETSGETSSETVRDSETCDSKKVTFETPASGLCKPRTENVEADEGSCEKRSDNSAEKDCELSVETVPTPMEVDETRACSNPDLDKGSVSGTDCAQTETHAEPHRTDESGETSVPPPPRLDKTESGTVFSEDME